MRQRPPHMRLLREHRQLMRLPSSGGGLFLVRLHSTAYAPRGSSPFQIRSRRIGLAREDGLHDLGSG